jgi:hypothetical protein
MNIEWLRSKVTKKVANMRQEPIHQDLSLWPERWETRMLTCTSTLILADKETTKKKGADSSADDQ